MAATTKDEMCPKCSIKMKKSSPSLTSNALFVTYKCESCTFSQMKCVGMLPEKDRY